MDTGIRILVVDDEFSLTALISEVLREDGHMVAEAASGEEALEIFRENPFPLVFSDIRMPGMSGMDLLKEIKNIRPETEIVIMTSHASLDTSVTALREGAYDYLIKPFEDLGLISAMANRVVEKLRLVQQNRELVSQLKQQNDELEEANTSLKELAVRDGLTGLYNHRYFQESLALELLRSRRYERTFSLLLLDVDSFKLYNDTHGHQAGDNLLRSLSEILQHWARKSDIVARYGGEEFVIILPETPKEGARIIAERLCQAIAETAFDGRETQPFGKITVSIGVATFPDDAADGSSLVQQADEQLYAAKENGRNAVCYNS
jgi:diguanylate cyclase (GGDEF)-like protein